MATLIKDDVNSSSMDNFADDTPLSEEVIEMDPDASSALEDEYYEDSEYLYDDPEDEEEDDGETVQTTNKLATGILVTALIIAILGAGLLIYNVVLQNSRDSSIKQWVSRYLYEQVGEQGAGILTDSEINTISSEVARQIASEYGEAGLDLNNLTDAQLADLVARVKTQLIAGTDTLTTSDVQTISEGVVERILQERGVVTGMDPNEMNTLLTRLSALETENMNLESRIATVQAQKGDKGDTGATGAQGPQGAQGAQGPQGAQGAQGATGATGAKGEKGDKGDKGEKGNTGARGEQGIQGLQGIQGEKGDTGAKGDKGDKGEQGIQGVKGEDGRDGNSTYIMYSANATGTGMTNTPNSTTKYIGSYSGNESAAPSDPAKYTWTEYREYIITFDPTTNTVVMTN